MMSVKRGGRLDTKIGGGHTEPRDEAPCPGAPFPCDLSDAHAHLGTREELEERRRAKTISLVCASTPPEAKALAHIAAAPEYASVILPACGLHPWHAAEYSVSDMEDFLAPCSVIGEIGMDSVWCSVPLSVQERVFREQLAIARCSEKPVILHTKGQEKEIAGILREYPNTYLVHWYSCPDYLEDYLELDCYFSVGPDVWWNQAVRNVAAAVPLNRLLVETDGMEAVRWAWEEGRKRAESGRMAGKEAAGRCKAVKTEGKWQNESAVQITPLPKTPAEALDATLRTTAVIRGIPRQELAAAVRKNFFSLIHS